MKRSTNSAEGSLVHRARRFDQYNSDYYKKNYLKIERYIEENKNSFVSLQSLGIEVDASAFYPSLEPYYNKGTIPFIRVADVKTIIDYDNCVKIPQMGTDFDTLYLAHRGDIVLTKGGRVGTAGLISRDSYVTRDLIFLNTSELSRTNYIALYLFFCTDFMYQQMIRSSSMTAQPHLTITLIRELLVSVFSANFKQKLSELFDKSEELQDSCYKSYKSAEIDLLNALGFSDKNASTSTVSIKKISASFLSSGRLDAEYYQPKYDGIFSALEQFETTSIPNEFEVYKNSGTEYAEGISDVGVIKTKQLTNDGIKHDSVESFFDNDICIKNKSTYLVNGDVVFASMGVGSLGKVSLFSYDGDKRFVTDSTLRIYRSKSTSKIKPEVLCVFLQSRIGQELIYRYVVGSTGIINIYDADIAKIPIPILDESVQKQIVAKVQESFALRHKSE